MDRHKRQLPVFEGVAHAWGNYIDALGDPDPYERRSEKVEVNTVVQEGMAQVLAARKEAARQLRRESMRKISEKVLQAARFVRDFSYAPTNTLQK